MFWKSVRLVLNSQNTLVPKRQLILGDKTYYF